MAEYRKIYLILFLEVYGLKRLLLLVVAAMLILAACGNEPEKEETTKKKEPEQQQEEVSKQKEKPESPESEDNDNSEVDQVEDSGDDEDDIGWDDVKEKDKIVGVSDKDFLTITKSKPSDVRNDKTGKWKKVTVADSFNIEEYALSYKDTYMKDGDVHFVINFTNKTTTRLNYSSQLLFVTVHEYVDKEEHDASKMPSGMVLKDYIIYPDGDIEEVQ